MKERSVTRRNLVGAFWGGFLGILVAGYLHPAVLPIGCFAGVVVGWWYQEIIVHVKRSTLRGVIKTRWLWRRSVEFIVTPVWDLKRRAKRLRIDVGPAMVVFHAIVFALAWFLRRPYVFWSWLYKHPMNRAYVLRVCAVATFYFIAALLLIVHLYFMWASGYFNDRVFVESVLGVFYGLGCLVFVVSVLMNPIIYLLRDLDHADQVRYFYRTWERFAARGAMRFFVGEVYYLLKVAAIMLTLMFATVLWFAGVGSVFVLCVLLPISACVGFVKGIYVVSTRAGHWLCFGITLCVTAITAWLTYPCLGDQRILWTVALCAGLASAGATEAIRHLILWAFSLSDRLQAMNYTPLDGQLSGSCRLFWAISADLEKGCNLVQFVVVQ